MNEEESPSSENFNQYSALSEKEKQQVENYLNRTPTPLEFNFFSLLWATEISLKNSIRWLNPQHTQDKSKFAKNLITVRIDDEWSCIFSMNSQCLTQEHPTLSFPELLSANATPIGVCKNWQLSDYQSNATKNFIKERTKKEANPSISAYHQLAFYHNQPDLSLVFSLNIGLVKDENSDIPATVETGDKLLLLNPLFLKNENNADDVTGFSNILNSEKITSIRYTNKFGIVPTLARFCRNFQKGIRLHFAESDETALNDWFISKSENQFLITIKAADKAKVFETLDATNCPFLEIGEVTDNSQIEIFLNDKQFVNIPTTDELEKGAGNRPFLKPKYLQKIPKSSIKKIKPPKDLVRAAKQLFLAPNIVSKRWIFQKEEKSASETKVCTNVLPLPNSEKSLIISSICQPPQAYTDPRGAAIQMVNTAVRQIICTGGTPLSMATNLNFGDLNDSEIYWQFSQTTRGIEEACSVLKIPMAGGELTAFTTKTDSKTTDFLPQPIIHAIGKLDNADDQIPLGFQEMSDLIYMVGNAQNDLAGSEYLRSVQKVPFSSSSYFDWNEAVELNRHLAEIIAKNLPVSINDVGTGGLFIALMESAMVQGLGFNIETVETYRRDAFLFGESQNRMLITVAPDQEETLLKYLISNNMAFAKLGEVFGNEIVIDGKNYGDIEKWKERHLNFLKEKVMGELV